MRRNAMTHLGVVPNVRLDFFAGCGVQSGFEVEAPEEVDDVDSEGVVG